MWVEFVDSGWVKKLYIGVCGMGGEGRRVRRVEKRKMCVIGKYVNIIMMLFVFRIGFYGFWFFL